MKRAALAALVVLLGTLVACSGTDDGKSPNRRVLVIGDSNLFNSARPVDEALRDAGFKPHLHGPPGYGLKDFDSYWDRVLPNLLEFDPALVVVGLGTNDTVSPDDVFLVPERIDQMMELIGDREVIWLTHVDNRPGADPQAGVTVNQAIRTAVERWDNLVILDFAQVIASDPDVLALDGLHLTREGARRYGRSIADAVRDVFEFCGGKVTAGCD